MTQAYLKRQTESERDIERDKERHIHLKRRHTRTHLKRHTEARKDTERDREIYIYRDTYLNRQSMYLRI